jgi:hypothetical protein
MPRIHHFFASARKRKGRSPAQASVCVQEVLELGTLPLLPGHADPPSWDEDKFLNVCFTATERSQEGSPPGTHRPNTAGILRTHREKLAAVLAPALCTSRDASFNLLLHEY